MATSQIMTCSASAMWRVLNGLHQFLEIVCTCWTVFDGTKPWVWADRFDKEKGDLQIVPRCRHVSVLTVFVGGCNLDSWRTSARGASDQPDAMRHH